jgi:hypothetical protein
MDACMKPDAIVKVYFLTSEDGGRKHAIMLSGKHYGCVVQINGDGYDCRVLQRDGALELGKTYEVPIKFLSPKVARPRFHAGNEITLWEGRVIAVGIVVEIIGSTDERA